MNSTTCISNFNYFYSPDFLKLSLHISSLISTPFYFLGMYCILFKTPDQMKSVKWYMFTLHSWIVFVDYLLAVLLVPYVLFPIPAGTTFGVLRHLGVPTSFDFFIFILVFGYMATSLVSVYENRFFILCQFQWKQKWAVGRRIWLIAHYVYFVVAYLPLFPLIPDQVEARKWLLQTSPCLPDYLYKEPLFVIAYDYSYLMTVCVPTVFVFCCELAFFILSLFHNAFKQFNTGNMSSRTYQMHKQLFIGLIIQTSVPLSMLVTPLIFLEIAVVINYHNQFLVNVGVVIVASHGLVTTIVMILVHKPYRLAMERLIRKDSAKRTPKVSMEFNKNKSTVAVPN